MTDGGGVFPPRFYYRVERIQDFIGDRPSSNPHKTWLYISVEFDGGLLSIDRGSYIVGLDSFTRNPQEEVWRILTLARVPLSSGSGNELIDDVAASIQRKVGSGGEGGPGMVPLLVSITMEEAYECILCGNEVEDGEGEEPECGHVFHQECFFDWLQEGEDTCCPTCGSEIDIDR